VNLQNKVAIVTGYSRDICTQIAKNLSRAGAKVVVNYASNQAAVDQMVAEIHSTGEEAIAARANLSNSTEVIADSKHVY
jgi:3-oxoacyl-[acyl-carrier protein] reductase